MAVMVVGGPPVIETRRSVLPSKKPTDSPLGEMKRPRGVPIPVRKVGSTRSNARTISWLLPRYTMREPSGVMARSRSPP